MKIFCARILKNQAKYGQFKLLGVKLVVFLVRYLALEGLCAMSQSDYSSDAVRKHQETIVKALKVSVFQ